jgi:hypothetical protein
LLKELRIRLGRPPAIPCGRPIGGVGLIRARSVVGSMLGAVVLLLAPASVPHVSAQAPSVVLEVTPIFPFAAIVGQTNIPGRLQIVNASAGVGPVTLTGITLNPACGDPTESCADPEPGVLQLSGTGAGSAGACLGTVFAISGPDADGRSVLTPSAPVTLGQPARLDDRCVIDFTFTVLSQPTKDASPDGGFQTRQFATATGSAFTLLLQPVSGGDAGSSTTSIIPRTPVLTTRASEPVFVGESISDVATLSGGQGPTGEITFDLYGPDDPTCPVPVVLDPVPGSRPLASAAVDRPIFTSTRVVIGNGDHVSDLFTPTVPGTYTWYATYSGDANNNAAGPTCNDAQETVVVSLRGTGTMINPTSGTTTTSTPGGATPTTAGPPGSPSTTTPALGRTGSNAAATSGLALLLVMVGAHLLALTLRRNER